MSAESSLKAEFPKGVSSGEGEESEKKDPPDGSGRAHRGHGGAASAPSGHRTEADLRKEGSEIFDQEEVKSRWHRDQRGGEFADGTSEDGFAVTAGWSAILHDGGSSWTISTRDEGVGSSISRRPLRRFANWGRAGRP